MFYRLYGIYLRYIQMFLRLRNGCMSHGGNRVDPKDKAFVLLGRLVQWSEALGHDQRHFLWLNMEEISLLWSSVPPIHSGRSPT